MINTFLTKCSILLLTALVIPQHTFAQELMSEELRFEVRKVDPPLSISQHQIQEAHRLADLNNEANELDLYFKPSWIRSYVSVEIVAIHQGKQRKAVGKNDILTREQKEIIQHADAGTPIAVRIQYLPDNTLSHNEVKSLDFEAMPSTKYLREVSCLQILQRFNLQSMNQEKSSMQMCLNQDFSSILMTMRMPSSWKLSVKCPHGSLLNFVRVLRSAKIMCSS